MEKIKFKAWDKANNEWYMNGDAFDLNFSGNYGIFFFDNDHPADMRDVELEWLQFTGLHDKNGKEIYEGDIIDFPTSGIGGPPYIIETINVFEMGSPATCPGIEYGEVIGNIYENPKLLTKEKQ